MYNNYKISKKVILNYSLLLCIVVAILMLSVGYAAIVATNLTVRGSASAGAQQGIFISNVEYLNNNALSEIKETDIDISNTFNISFVCTYTYVEVDITFSSNLISCLPHGRAGNLCICRFFLKFVHISAAE